MKDKLHKKISNGNMNIFKHLSVKLIYIVLKPEITETCQKNSKVCNVVKLLQSIFKIARLN